MAVSTFLNESTSSRKSWICILLMRKWTRKRSVFNKLIKKCSTDKFHRYTYKCQCSAVYLHNPVKDSILKKQNTGFREAIPSEPRLAYNTII